jgi:O-antigen/teichoic acid export membrane protein
MSVIFPKIIDLLSSDDHNKISDTLESIRAGFISSSHFLIYVAMLFFPVLVIMLPKYTNALTSMNLIALAILMNTNSYGYSTLLIAKNKEKTAALISFWALILNIALAVFLSNILKVSFSYVILATLASYLFFSFLIVMKGKEAIGVYKIHETLINFFPLRLVIPYIAALFISLLNIIYLIWVPIFLYLLFNMSDIKMMLCMAQKLVHNPNISDI